MARPRGLPLHRGDVIECTVGPCRRTFMRWPDYSQHVHRSHGYTLPWWLLGIVICEHDEEAGG